MSLLKFDLIFENSACIKKCQHGIILFKQTLFPPRYYPRKMCQSKLYFLKNQNLHDLIYLCLPNNWGSSYITERIKKISKHLFVQYQVFIKIKLNVLKHEVHLNFNIFVKQSSRITFFKDLYYFCLKQIYSIYSEIHVSRSSGKTIENSKTYSSSDPH